MNIIDNSGRGNCMYYAYAISLMYYLRQKDEVTRNEIFKKLRLSEDNIIELCKLFPDKWDVISQFTLSETKAVERILGSACRELAGDNTKKEFLTDPAGSSMIAASVFGLARALKETLKPAYARFITLPDKRRRAGRPSAADAFTNAEIFKVDSINAALTLFSKKIANEVVKKFEERNGFCAADPKKCIN